MVATVHKLVEENVATKMGISQGTASSILSEHLGLSKLSVQWVPKTLRPDLLIQWADLSMNSLNKIEANEEEFMDRLITGDET